MDRPFKAIVVGIEMYEDAQTWKTLHGVGDIAARVARSLGAQPLALPYGGLKNEAPKAIKDAINALPERATLFLHWIGHGVTADQHYLICRDSPGPAKLDGFEALPSGELGRIIANSRAERMVVVIDTCYSGDGGGNLAQRYRDSLARALDRQGWQRVACVIASSHPLDAAVAGRFSQGMVDVLENPDRHQRWRTADAYIDPERLAMAIMDTLGEANKEVHPRFSKEGFGQDIIPNPLFRPLSGTEDLETRARLEGVFGEQAHFNLAARGIEAGEAGFFFTGRRRSQNEIIQWLKGQYSDLLIVTGPPGSGKSALIGRIVTLSVPEVRAQLQTERVLHDNDPFPPENSIDIAIHAKGKSVFQVATALGQAIKLGRTISDQPGIAEVLERVKAVGGPRTIVIDALDEAGSGQAERIANEIIRPLAAMPEVRVLVGTRRSLDGAVVPDGEQRHALLVKAFGSGASIRDLADEPETSADIAQFVARRLHAARVRGPDPWIAEASAKVAAAANGSFLYARLVARRLEDVPNAPLHQLPAGATAAFAEDIASRFSDDRVRVTDMLRAVAFGLGRGLSRAVWAPIASALTDGKRTYADEDIVWMLRNVGSYIVETTVETDGIGQAVYRLIHQALADHLQKEPHRAHQRIVEAITRGLEGEAWLGADLYLRRHLLEHAVLADRVRLAEAASHITQVPLDQMSAGERRTAEEQLAHSSELDQLFRTPGVLAMSEPSVVLAMRPHLISEEARRTLGICRLAANRLASVKPHERWSLLHLTALMQGNRELSAEAKPPGSSAWLGIWARTRLMTPHLAIRTQRGRVLSVAAGTVNGRALIVTGGRDGIVRLWDAEDGTPVGAPMAGLKGGAQMSGFKLGVCSVALGAVNGRWLIVSGGDDGRILLWDAEDRAPVGPPITGHEGTVLTVALGTVNGRALIVSGGDDGTVRLWDAEAGTQVGAPMTGHAGGVFSVSLGTINGRALIVSGGDDGTVRLWDLEGGKPFKTPIMSHDVSVNSVALGTVNGSEVIVSGTNDGRLWLWDQQAWTPVGDPVTGHAGFVKSVALGAVNGRALIVSGGLDHTVRLWDAGGRTPIGAPMEGHDDFVNSVALTTVNGRTLIVSGGADGTARLWDTEAETLVGAQMNGHEGAVYSVSLGTVNGRALIVSGSGDGAVRLLDANNGVPVREPIEGHGRVVNSVALGTAIGRPLIVSGGDDGTVRLWDPEDGMPIGAPMTGHTDRVNSVAVGTVNNRVLIVSGGNDGTVRLWDPEAGTPIGAPLTGHTDGVNSVALGTVNDRVLIVSGGDDGTVRLWDAEDGRPAGARMMSHERRVLSVAVGTVNGRVQVVSGGNDGTVRLWDAATQDEILSIPLGRRILALVMSGNGEVFVATTKGLAMLQIRI